MKKIDLRSIDWKKVLPYLAILGVFIIASLIYFWPAIDGKIIYAGDSINAISAVQESVEFRDSGGNTFWTGSMFSGMPNYQIGGGKTLTSTILRPIYKVLHRGPARAYLIFFFYLIAFFALLQTFGVNKWLSMAGAFAIALSSYFFVIIAAQHGGKTISITWMMFVVIGFYLTYRKKYWFGAILVMLFIPIGFFKHPQMSYYICMMIGILFFAELAIAAKVKEWKHFAIASSIFFASFAVGMGIGSANIFTNQEYAEQTMRGGHSDLVKETDAENKTKGLDLDYATAWSYGKSETMTFLIPNYMGGASGYNVGEKSVLYDELVKARVPRGSAKQFCQSAPTYWGDKAFTSGPVYIGAIVCLLFVLALLIAPGPYKWALLVATLFSVFLAWGKNFMPFTRLFFDYFPVYNKFRAVESILIVAEITMPLLAMLGIKQLVETADEDKKKYQKPLLVAAGITAGICLIFALFGGSFLSFTSSYDAQWKGQVGNEIYRMIIDQRAAMMTADAWRSFGFIIVSAALLWFYIYKPFKTSYLGIALTALVILDMWPVDKRFCNDAMFTSKKDEQKIFAMLPYEKEILQDSSYYRVLNMSTNTFNEARTSYYLHSIGGYSAAKLRRYQDLIDVHISKEMSPFIQATSRTGGQLSSDPLRGTSFPVLNMLNMKYAVLPIKDGQSVPIMNPWAMGPAWLVDEVRTVSSPNEEIETLDMIDLRHIAVADEQFAPILASPNIASKTDKVDFVEYKPNELTYKTTLANERVVVFSEIYYPYGWYLYLEDGTEIPLARVNYMLRAAVIPAGEHSLRMVFDPESVKKGDRLALACMAILLMTVIAALAMKFREGRKRDTESETV